MCVYLFLVSFFTVTFIAGAAPALSEGLAPVQSRLRGSFNKPARPSATQQLITGQRYSDDDESCSSEGVTPGVCALSFLARPAASSEPEGLLVHDRARDKLEQALIAEIDSALADNHSAINKTQLRRLEQELQPVFATLPHKQSLADGSEGGLDYPAARYLLHQHFVRQSSWYVRGLNPSGDGRLPPSQKESLRSRVAGHLLKVLDDKVGIHGFSLNMLAIFVATLEHLLQGDQHELLKRVWVLHGLQADSVTDRPGLKSVLTIFMAHTMHSSDYFQGSELSLEAASKEVQDMEDTYYAWPKIVLEINKHAEVASQTVSLKDSMLFADQLLQFFSKVSGSMCHDMEQSIGKFSGGAEGLVSLADLRTLHADSNPDAYLVTESVEYLRELGVLDENSGDPYVLVPNYMLSSTNCDMSTSFYDLCCPNPCEHHKEHLEHALAGAKTNHSGVIMEIVQQRLGRPMPADMARLLDGIASGHNGTIPIHGRGFADWLSKVFPQDCPRARAQDFRGVEGDMVPDANAEFQPQTINKAPDGSKSWQWLFSV